MRYADASALISAYLTDEVDHPRWRGSILEGTEPVVSTELVRAEVASAIARAGRVGRVRPELTLARFEADCGPGGPIQLLALDAEPVLGRAVLLAQEHPVFAMDAIHLAVALEQALPLADDEPIAFLTGDRRQAAAARALGFADPEDPTFLATMARLMDVEAGVFVRPDELSDEVPGEEA